MRVRLGLRSEQQTGDDQQRREQEAGNDMKRVRADRRDRLLVQSRKRP